MKTTDGLRRYAKANKGNGRRRKLADTFTPPPIDKEIMTSEENAAAVRRMLDDEKTR